MATQRLLPTTVAARRAKACGRSGRGPCGGHPADTLNPSFRILKPTARPRQKDRSSVRPKGVVTHHRVLAVGPDVCARSLADICGGKGRLPDSTKRHRGRQRRVLPRRLGDSPGRDRRLERGGEGDDHGLTPPPDPLPVTHRGEGSPGPHPPTPSPSERRGGASDRRFPCACHKHGEPPPEGGGLFWIHRREARRA